MTSTNTSSDTVVQASEYVSYKRFDSEIVLVDLKRGEYFALDDVSARMWEQLVAGMTPAEVATCLATEFDASTDVILRDCTTLLGELLRRGLVVERKP